jgi:hypothetical protein
MKAMIHIQKGSRVFSESGILDLDAKQKYYWVKNHEIQFPNV